LSTKSALWMTLLQCDAGDRPVEITLERMWAALSWRKRAAFLRALVADGAPPGGAPSAAGAAGADDAVAAVIAQLSASFPEVGHNPPGGWLYPLVACRCARQEPHACSVPSARAGRSCSHPGCRVRHLFGEAVPTRVTDAD